MNNVYIDTSAFFKIFVEEEASDVVERIVELAKKLKIQITLSDWVINESLALVDENRRKARIDSTQSQHILSEIVAMIEKRVEYSQFTFYTINENAIKMSRFIIQDFHIPASDALHVFIAVSASCDCLVSADNDLITQIRSTTNSLLAYNIRINEDIKNLFERLPKIQ